MPGEPRNAGLARLKLLEPIAWVCDAVSRKDYDRKKMGRMRGIGMDI
jgi:hypothetical protein